MHVYTHMLSWKAKGLPANEQGAEVKDNFHPYVSHFDTALVLFLHIDLAFVNMIELRLCSIQLARPVPWS